LFENV
jgi:mevalonate kinase